MSVKTYITLEHPKINWDIPLLMTYPYVSLNNPKFNKIRRDILGLLEIKQKQMGYPWIT